MTRIVLNETLRRLLPSLSRLVEFRDEKGHVVGRFFPEIPLLPMTRIVVNETLRSLLPDLSRLVEFCDENGEVLGHFRPEAPLYIGREPPPLSDEELRRRETEDPTYTTAEVLAYLESLESGIE